MPQLINLNTINNSLLTKIIIYIENIVIVVLIKIFNIDIGQYYKI